MLLIGGLPCLFLSVVVGRQKAFVFSTASASISPTVTHCIVNLFVHFALFSNKANCIAIVI